MAITINGNGTLTGVSVGGLPDGIVDTDMLASNAVTAAKSSGLGITHARTYRITTAFTLTSGSADITSNWEYDDSTGVGFLGSGWALPSSGAFSFPATGIYEVRVHSSWYAGSGTNTPYGGLTLVGTANNFSSEGVRAQAYSSQSDDLNQARYHNVHVSAIFDVTDTSNNKFKIKTYRDPNYDNIVIVGGSSENNTYVEVIRLGDT